MCPTDEKHSAENLTVWLTERFAAHVRRAADEIDPTRPFADYGLDSIGAMSLSVDIEDHFGLVLDASQMWDRPTVAALSELLAEELTKREPRELSAEPTTP